MLPTARTPKPAVPPAAPPRSSGVTLAMAETERTCHGLIARDRLDDDRLGGIKTVLRGLVDVKRDLVAEGIAAVEARRQVVGDARIGGVLTRVVIGDEHGTGERVDGQ